MRSLADVDDARQKAEPSQKALDEVLGGADVVKRRRMLISEIVADTYKLQHHTIYAMEPSLSRAHALVAASDPDFRNTKPAAAAKSRATTKEGPKAKETPKP
jgi:hypothetical protein